jgi:anti-sigma factor RsiW
MRLEAQAQECPRYEIAAYIDGELSAAEELALDHHMVECRVCAHELNDQKSFLNNIEVSLRNIDLELPKDFTKIVVANAESNVTGVRRWSELYNAAFATMALLIFILFALGPDARSVLDGTRSMLEQSLAVGSILGHLVYSIFLGVTIVLRSFASVFRLDLVLTAVFVVVSVVSLMLASRKWLRFGRA